LNYRPNVLARSLRRQSTKVVGVLVPDLANPFSSELIQGIESVLLEQGYNCFITASLRSVEREKSALAAFIDHRVDGLLVATRETRTGNEALADAVERGTRVVTIGREFHHDRVDHVTADHWRGAFDATAHLIGLGHKKIGFLGASIINGAGLRRFAGYLDALREHGIEPKPAWIVGPAGESPTYSTHEDGYAGIKQLLAQRTRPTAVLCRNDFTAIGALRAVRDLGRTVPGDIAVVGFDNIPISAYMQPPLTTVEQPTAEQGRLAGRMLVERLTETYRGSRREDVLPCRLVIRQSSGANL
ncbi:MAG: LacI family DNA-binding transcriptional regulator, partial [Bryobacteraceae bacterium]